MTLEEKRELVSQNKEPIIAALQAVLDTHYNYLAPVTVDNALCEDMFKDKKALAFAKGLKADADNYEDVLMKVKKNEELSAVDIARIGICVDFCRVRAEQQMESIKKARVLLIDLAEKLSSNVNESQAAQDMRKLIQKYDTKS